MEDFYKKEVGSIYTVSSIKKVELLNSNWLDSLSNPTSTKNMFAFCQNLANIKFIGVDTSNITDMSDMFFYCNKLKKLDLKSFNTSNVTNMCEMFGCCYHLEEINLSSFNTSKVTDMQFMFSQCRRLETLDLSSFDISNVENMDCMFEGCTNLLELDVSNFIINDNNKETGADMFRNCVNLYTIKCKQSFKDWCLENSDFICLPEIMLEDGDGVWEIVD